MTIALLPVNCSVSRFLTIAGLTILLTLHQNLVIGKENFALLIYRQLNIRCTSLTLPDHFYPFS